NKRLYGQLSLPLRKICRESLLFLPGDSPSMFRWLLCFVLLSFSSTFAADNAAAQSLHKLFDSDWEYQMVHDPITASELGDYRFNDKWPDSSLAGTKELFRHAREALDQLHAIDRSQLSPEDQLNYDVFEYNTKDSVESEQYKWFLVRTNTFSGLQ